MVDILKAKTYFKNYVSNYGVDNPKIEIKIIHTYNVANNSRNIAKRLGLSEEQQDLAELIGLLHDIGRFEQLRIYNTFFDKISIDHARKGVEVLFDDNEIRNFIKDSSYDKIIYKAVYNHNKMEIEDCGLSQDELLYTKIVRDADNLDIFRVFIDQKIEDCVILGTKDISKEKLTPKFLDYFKKEELLLYSDANTDMDFMVVCIAHIYGLNFKETLKILKEKDYINKIVKKLNCQDKYTKEKMDEIALLAMKYIDKRINFKDSM